MSAFDWDSYNGLTVSEAMESAQQTTTTADEALHEAKAIYEICLNQDIDIYFKGKIRQRLWEIEKRLGRFHLYLSQAGQDRFIHQEFFKDNKRGTFVEIGAYNGWVGSNCFFFEKVRDWTGLVVEASPRLISRIREVRSAKIVHAAISDHDGTADFIDVSSGHVQMGGLADHYRPEVIDHMRHMPEHVEDTIRVKTMRLQTLLETHNIREVDYCSIDVEGAESAILSAFDFEAFNISVLSIENKSGGRSGGFAQILEPAGYRLASVIGVDEIWVR